MPTWAWVIIVIVVLFVILVLSGALSGSVSTGALFLLPFFSRRSTTDSASGS